MNLETDQAKSLFLEKGPLFEKNVWKIAKEYTDWWPSRPSFVIAHGDHPAAYEFLKSLSSKYAPSTLWGKLHHLRHFLFLQYAIPYDEYPMATIYLKNLNNGYQPKKAKIFEVSGPKGIINIWRLPFDNDFILLFQVMSLAAVFSADRGKELESIMVADVVFTEEGIEIDTSRLKGTKRLQKHLIPNCEAFSATKIFQVYLERAHPEPRCPESRFFRNVHPKSKKFFASPCGKHQWTTCAREIAKILGYSEEEQLSFSSHSFRSTCATALAENGASIEQIMVHGNWNSVSVMQGYIRETKRFRRETASLVLGPSSSSSSSGTPNANTANDPKPPVHVHVTVNVSTNHEGEGEIKKVEVE